MSSNQSGGELVVVAGPRAELGFRLAGARTLTCDSAAEATTLVDDLARRGEAAVIAVHGALWSQLSPATQRRLTELDAPLVVGIPTGDGQAIATHQAELSDLLTRAVGFQITFEEEQDG